MTGVLYQWAEGIKEVYFRGMTMMNAAVLSEADRGSRHLHRILWC